MKQTARSLRLWFGTLGKDKATVFSCEKCVLSERQSAVSGLLLGGGLLALHAGESMSIKLIDGPAMSRRSTVMCPRGVGPIISSMDSGHEG